MLVLTKIINKEVFAGSPAAFKYPHLSSECVDEYDCIFGEDHPMSSVIYNYLLGQFAWLSDENKSIVNKIKELDLFTGKPSTPSTAERMDILMDFIDEVNGKIKEVNSVLQPDFSLIQWR